MSEIEPVDPLIACINELGPTEIPREVWSLCLAGSDSVLSKRIETMPVEGAVSLLEAVNTAIDSVPDAETQAQLGEQTLGAVATGHTGFGILRQPTDYRTIASFIEQAARLTRFAETPRRGAALIRNLARKAIDARDGFFDDQTATTHLARSLAVQLQAAALLVVQEPKADISDRVENLQELAEIATDNSLSLRHAAGAEGSDAEAVTLVQHLPQSIYEQAIAAVETARPRVRAELRARVGLSMVSSALKLDGVAQDVAIELGQASLQQLEDAFLNYESEKETAAGINDDRCYFLVYVGRELTSRATQEAPENEEEAMGAVRQQLIDLSMKILRAARVYAEQAREAFDETGETDARYLLSGNGSSVAMAATNLQATHPELAKELYGIAFEIASLHDGIEQEPGPHIADTDAVLHVMLKEAEAQDDVTSAFAIFEHAYELERGITEEDRVSAMGVEIIEKVLDYIAGASTEGESLDDTYSEFIGMIAEYAADILPIKYAQPLEALEHEVIDPVLKSLLRRALNDLIERTASRQPPETKSTQIARELIARSLREEK